MIGVNLLKNWHLRRTAAATATVGLMGVALALGQASPPEWYSSGRHPRYPAEFYFVGVGSGSTYEAAAAQAQVQISQQIQVTVQSEVTRRVDALAVDDRESVRDEYQSQVRSLSEADLTGAEVVERYSAGGVHYVMLALDKRAYVQSLETDLSNLAQTAAQAAADAADMLSRGMLTPALEGLSSARRTAVQFAAKSALVSALGGVVPPLAADDGALLTRMRNIVAAVHLVPVSGNNQVVRVGDAFAQPLVVRAVYRGEGGAEVALSALPLALRDAAGKTLDRRLTDAAGTAAFTPEAGTPGKGRFTVAVDPAAAPELVRKDLARREIAFEYEARSAGPFTFALTVYNLQGVREFRAEEVLAKSITALGHRVSSDGTMLLVGRFKAGEVHKVEGYGGSKYVAKTVLELFLKDIETGEVLGSVTLTAQGFDEASEARATSKSYENIKLSRADLAKLLERGGE